MACLVVYKEDEGLVLVPLLQPVYGLVRDDIGTIALGTLHAAVHLDEVGIVVLALSVEHLEIVKAGRRAHQVPLADEGRLVARLLEQFGHGLLRTVKDAVLVVGKSILVTVLARQHTGT